jgi:creatinine amidohydrolase
MKRYMPEMTNLQVREYMEGGGRTVLVPVGSTEDHGDHGPLWTDVYIPLEVCKRAAEELDALVGPPVPFGLAPDHRGASGIIYVRLATFISMLRDICVSLAEAGFERIALVNGHYVNTTAMQYAAAEMFDDLPRGVRVFPFAYWQGLQPEQAEAYLSGSAGLHANVGETSAVLAIDPDLCDMERVRDFVPELDGFMNHPLALLDPVFLSTPGSFWALLEEGGGVWGNPSESTVEKGEQFLQWGAASVVSLVRDMETMHDRIAPGYERFRQPPA